MVLLSSLEEKVDSLLLSIDSAFAVTSDCVSENCSQPTRGGHTCVDFSYSSEVTCNYRVRRVGPLSLFLVRKVMLISQLEAALT